VAHQSDDAPDVFGAGSAVRPEVSAALDELRAAAWNAVDPDLLALCQARIAMLLGSQTSDSAADERHRDLADWPSSPRFSATQRACLAFTEQFVIDVTAMSDELVAAVTAALGADGLVNFVNALLVVEQRQRLQLISRRLMPAAAA
jgi:hypothetical protein